jgi:hypothetical protein
MLMEGSARVRRARLPRVLLALRRRPALRTRMRVMRRRGKEPLSGAPRRARSWLEKVSIAGRRSSLCEVSFWFVFKSGFVHIGLDDDSSPLGDQPALSAAFDFHVAYIDDEVNCWRPSNAGTQWPFCSIDEATEVLLFEYIAAHAGLCVELYLCVDCEIAYG